MADFGKGLSSTDALAISNSRALSPTSRTRAPTPIFTVAGPVKVSLSMLGTMRTEYSVGTTSFCNFPGVVAKSKVFSPLMLVEKIVSPITARTRRMSANTRNAAALQSLLGLRPRIAHKPCQMTPAIHELVRFVIRMRVPSLRLLSRVPLVTIHNQDQQQLAAADLRAFNHDRTLLAQLGFRFEKQLLVLKQLQVQLVSAGGYALGVDVQREIFARSQPVFVAGL